MRRERMGRGGLATISATGEAKIDATSSSKPIRSVVPRPAGGSTDLMARFLQEPLTKILGQQVFVDNRPGAAGAIGTREVATAPADGHTLVFSNNGPTSIAPTIQKDAGYDSL